MPIDFIWGARCSG